MERSCINCVKNDVCKFYHDGMKGEFVDTVEGDIVKLLAEFQVKWASECHSYLEKR